MKINKIKNEEVVLENVNEDEVLKAKIASVANQIEELCKENKVTLYSYLDRQPNGTFPRVTLVPVVEKKDDKTA